MKSQLVDAGETYRRYNSNHKQKAVLTIEESRSMMYQFVKYFNRQIRPNYPYTREMIESGIAQCPMAIWEYGIRNIQSPRQVTDKNRDMLYFALLRNDIPFRASGKGISYKGLYYWDESSWFLELSMKMNREEKKSIKISGIRYDPRLVDRIYRMENGRLTGAIVPVLDKLKGIDAVAAGDSHTVFSCSYKGIPAVQAGEYGRQIGHIKLFYDADTGKVTQAEANVYETGALTQEGDSKAAAFLQPHFERVDAVYSKVLAYNTQYLANEKYGESPLADYFMDLINGELETDITLYNGGAIRANLPAGNVTLKELKQIFPFNNTLYVVRLRGSDILKALEHGLCSKEIGRVRFAGLTVTADLTVPEGERLISAQLADGSMLSPERYYSVAVNDFLLSGGDGYTSVKGAEIIRESGKDLDILSTALKKAGQINFDYNNKRLILK